MWSWFWLIVIASLLQWLACWARRRQAGARASTTAKVSGNGPKWEQDKPFPECFDEMEDDL